MKTKKIITQEEYDRLPGNGAAQILNQTGDDGQPILKYAQCNLKDGSVGIVIYWNDENGQRWKRAEKFISGNEY